MWTFLYTFRWLETLVAEICNVENWIETGCWIFDSQIDRNWQIKESTPDIGLDQTIRTHFKTKNNI